MFRSIHGLKIFISLFNKHLALIYQLKRFQFSMTYFKITKSFFNCIFYLIKNSLLNSKTIHQRDIESITTPICKLNQLMLNWTLIHKFQPLNNYVIYQKQRFSISTKRFDLTATIESKGCTIPS